MCGFFTMDVVSEQLVQRRGAADDRRLLVTVGTVVDTRRAGEVAEAGGNLRTIMLTRRAVTTMNSVYRFINNPLLYH